MILGSFIGAHRRFIYIYILQRNRFSSQVSNGELNDGYLCIFVQRKLHNDWTKPNHSSLSEGSNKPLPGRGGEGGEDLQTTLRCLTASCSSILFISRAVEEATSPKSCHSRPHELPKMLKLIKRQIRPKAIAKWRE